MRQLAARVPRLVPRAAWVLELAPQAVPQRDPVVVLVEQPEPAVAPAAEQVAVVRVPVERN